jgi:hypothetical protein
LYSYLDASEWRKINAFLKIKKLFLKTVSIHLYMRVTEGTEDIW